MRREANWTDSSAASPPRRAVTTSPLPSLLVVLSAMGVPYDARAQAHEWSIQTVDAPRSFAYLSNRSIQVDSDGRPHFTYGGDQLYYAWSEGSVWHSETADSAPGVGSFASLVLDSQGSPHIAYLDGPGGRIKHAWRSPSGWITEGIDITGSDDQSYSLALDAADRPHVSFHNEASYDLRYAFRDASGWHLEIVASEGYVGKCSSIVVDSAGFPHISYQGVGLDYARRDASGWHIEHVDDEGYAGLHTSIALTRAGSPMISYRGDGQLKLAWLDDGTWMIDTVSDTFTDWTSLAVESGDIPHVSATAAHPSYALCHFLKDSAGWHEEPLGEVGLFTSIAVGDDGHPHISCYDHNSRALLHAYRSNVGWVIWRPETSSSVGYYNSLGLDGFGHPHIAYQDGTHGHLEYCSWDGSLWHTEVIDSSGFVGTSASLALDECDRPHIGYIDQTSEALKYAHWYDGRWDIETVDFESRVRLSSALALGQGGLPRIAYGDWQEDALKYAVSIGAGWRIDVVCQGGTFMAIDMVTDADDQPHLSFVDGATLRYAWSDGQAWATEDVGPWGSVNFVKTDLELDESGHPHIAYNLNSGVSDVGELWYATLCDSGWRRELVTSASPLCGYVSLALDEDGCPYLSYYGHDTHSLALAHRTESGWSSETVDADGWIGRHTSLKIDPLGALCVAYQDASRGDLKFAESVGLGAGQTPSPTHPTPTLRLLGPVPCRGGAQLHLCLPSDIVSSVAVFDVQGRRLVTLFEGPWPPGGHRLIWDGLDDRGLRVPSGTYICSAEAGGARVSTRVVLIR